MNRRGTPVAGICEIRGYSSVDAMIDAAEIALAKFIEHSEKEANGTISLMESQAHEYLKTYVKIASDISKFLYPQRKAIDVKQDPTNNMTPEQRLEAMKHAVALLELKARDKSGSGTL